MTASVRRLAAAAVAAGLFASTAAAQTYYYPPPPSGQVVAASATLTVRLPEKAVLRVNGKVVEGSGAVRTVLTDTVPIGQEATVTLRIGVRPRDGRDHAGGPPRDPNAAPRPTGDDPASGITRTVTVRAFGTAEVDFSVTE